LALPPARTTGFGFQLCSAHLLITTLGHIVAIVQIRAGMAKFAFSLLHHAFLVPGSAIIKHLASNKFGLSLMARAHDVHALQNSDPRVLRVAPGNNNIQGKVALESEANAPAPLVSLWSARVAFWGNLEATQLFVSN